MTPAAWLMLWALACLAAGKGLDLYERRPRQNRHGDPDRYDHALGSYPDPDDPTHRISRRARVRIWLRSLRTSRWQAGEYEAAEYLRRRAVSQAGNGRRAA